MLRIITSFIFFLGLVPFSQAKIVEGVDVADVIQVGDQPLVLNGTGVRSKFFIDVYLGALYLPGLNDSAQSIVKADKPMNIRLFIMSSLIDGDKMSEATLEGFENSTEGNMEPIQSEIDSLITAFRDAVEENDVFDLQYIPGQGVSVIRNGELKTVVPGLAFKQALFGIWLGEDPAQNSLKDGMLGDD